eukprot:s1799_g6.t1
MCSQWSVSFKQGTNKREEGCSRSRGKRFPGIPGEKLHHPGLLFMAPLLSLWSIPSPHPSHSILQMPP